MPPAHKPRGAAAHDIPQSEPITAMDRMAAVQGIFQIAQFGCLSFGQFADAAAIGMHGPNLATEVAKLAEANPRIAKKVDLLIEVGPYAGIVAAGIPFVVQILVNHGVFKAEQFANAGIVSPEALSMQMKTQMVEQQMAAAKAQEEAEQRLQEMMAEMAESSNHDSEEQPANA